MMAASKPKILFSSDADILKCCICLDIFRDPRSLPCIHTFCLECLEQLGDAVDKIAGEETECPLCRCKFTVPTGGFNKLPKNSFIVDMLERKVISEPPKDVVCDICSEEGSPALAATAFCADCKHRLCEKCSKHHRRMAFSSEHCLIPLGAPMKELMSNVVTYCDCDGHQRNRIEMYCTVCQTATCNVCHLAGDHKSHDCIVIKLAADEEKKRLKTAIDRVDQKMAENMKTCKRLDESKSDFEQKISEAEKEVSDGIHKLKILIETHAAALSSEIADAKATALKKIDVLKEEFELQHVMMESYVKYARELADTGSPCSVIRCAKDLNNRAKELESLKQPRDDTMEMSLGVKFDAADLERLTSVNTVGRLTFGKSRVTRVKHMSTEAFRPVAVDNSDRMCTQTSAGGSEIHPECCYLSSIDDLMSELTHNKEVCITFSDCMFDHLKLIDLRQLEHIALDNRVMVKYRNRRFVGISGEQKAVNIVQKEFFDLALQEHRKLCKQHVQPGEDVGEVAQRESLEDHTVQLEAHEFRATGPVSYANQVASSDTERTDAFGSSIDGPPNRGIQELMPQDQGAGTNQAASSDTADTEYIDIEQHIWNYILYKNCNLISEFGIKYECSISAIPYDSGSVKMCKVAISRNKSNKAKLHEVAEEICELCRVLMVGDIVECAVNFPSRSDVDFFQRQLESIDVLVASSPCSLIGPSRSIELAKSKFEAAVWSLGRNSESGSTKQQSESAFGNIPMVPRDLQDDLLRFETRSGLSVHVRCGNIIQQKTEVIVDAANTRLCPGSGVAKAIADAAGKQVEDECRKYIMVHGELRTGDPMHTSAGKLKSPIRYIIHIAGPDSSKYKDKNLCQEHLQQTFFNCLQYANERLGVCSITIPAISSGVYGIPKEVVARRAYAALMDYDSRLLENLKLPRRLRDIHFVNIDVETTSVMERVLREMCGDDTSSPPPYLSPAANTQDKMMQNAAENQLQAAGVHNGNAQNSPIVYGVGRGKPAAFHAVSDAKPTYQRRPSADRGVLRQNSQNEPGGDVSGDSPKANFNRSNSLSAERPATDASAQSPSTPDELTPAFSSEKINAESEAKVDESKGGNASQFEHNNQPVGTGNQRAAADSGTENVKGSPDDFQDSSDTTPALEQQDAAAAATGNAAAVNDDDLLQAKVATNGDDKDKKTDDVCVICMDKIENPLRLDCGHVFCEECIAGCFEKHQPKCPSCGLLYGVLRGNQPYGTFRYVTSNYNHLSGYDKYGTIEIAYNFPSGTQSDEHPNPGMPYKGTTRTAYLPDSPEGREVLQLLKRAFDARLLFTIDRSVTTGQENVVVWNDIHHKTKPSGPHGYPDSGYLDRVKSELAAKGISSDPPVVNATRKRNKKK